MKLKDVYEMVSAYWAKVAEDEQFRDRLVYEAIVCRQSKQSVELLRVRLSPNSYEFALARIKEIHRK